MGAQCFPTSVSLELFFIVYSVFLLFIKYFSVYIHFNFLNTFLENKIVLMFYMKKKSL